MASGCLGGAKKGRCPPAFCEGVDLNLSRLRLAFMWNHKSLSLERYGSPLFECPRIVVLEDSFMEGSGQSPCKHVNSLQSIDVVLGVSYELLKLGNILIKILPLHLDSLA